MSENNPITYLRHRIAQVVDQMHGATLLGETMDVAPPESARIEFEYGEKRYVITLSEISE